MWKARLPPVEGMLLNNAPVRDYDPGPHCIASVTSAVAASEGAV